MKKRWVFTFRVEPPAGVMSARIGGSYFFAAYSRLLRQWYWIYPGGEEKIDEPNMIYVEQEWADAHKRDLAPQPLATSIRRSKKPVQLQLF